MCGFQAAGAAPIVLGHPVENPETFATAIRIGNPASLGARPTAARDESGGLIETVTDDEILAAYREVVRLAGDLLRARVGREPGGRPQAARRRAGSTRTPASSAC